MPQDDPVTDTGGITDRAPVNRSSATDKKGVTAPADKEKQNAAAKPSIGKLLIYDASLGADFPTALRDTYYIGAKLVPIKTWADIQTALSKYSSIGTLIVDTHSTPGNLLIDHRSPAESKQREALASTGVKVTGAIIFEGCSIMADPAATAKLVSGIAGPSTRVSGFTYFSITQVISITLGGSETKSEVRQMFERHGDYLLPHSKSPDKLAGTKASFKLYKRWFRAELNESPLPDHTPGSFPPKGVKNKNDMTKVTVSNKEKAAEVKADADTPVPSGYFVTVDNIKAVASP